MNKLNIYNECINAMDKFEGTSVYDELLEGNYNNLDFAIYNLILILDRLIEESETEEEIKFYNEMANKMSPINPIN